jgi:PTS system mannose-specific IID component
MVHLKLEQRIFLRSLLWQASWNFARMQCLGLAYAIYPLLEKLYGKGSKKLNQRLKCYLVCFNTNPYLAAAILGFLVHMESQGEEMGDQGLALSGNLAGLYGAVGDNFFWGGLKPMVSVLAVMIYFWKPGLLAPLFLVLVYNVIHLGLRYSVFLYGLHRGIGVIEVIDRWHLPRFKEYMELVTAGALATTLFFAARFFGLSAAAGNGGLGFVVLLLVTVGLVWYRLRKNGGSVLNS